MPNMIIVSPDPAGFSLDRDTFEGAVVKKYGDQVTLVQSRDSDDPVDVTAQIDRPGESWFQIFYFRGGNMLSTDATGERVADVALWVRSLLPSDPGVRVWLVDQGYNGHVELAPGMTEEDIKSGWVDHAQSSSEQPS